MKTQYLCLKKVTSPLVFNTSLNRYSFPPPNNTNSFRAVDYDVHVNCKIHYSNNHVSKSMTLQELNRLHYAVN